MWGVLGFLSQPSAVAAPRSFVHRWWTVFLRFAPRSELSFVPQTHDYSAGYPVLMIHVETVQPVFPSTLPASPAHVR